MFSLETLSMLAFEPKVAPYKNAESCGLCNVLQIIKAEIYSERNSFREQITSVWGSQDKSFKAAALLAKLLLKRKN